MTTAVKDRPKHKTKTQPARKRVPPTRPRVVAAGLPPSLVTFLLDRSGSMSSIKSQTIEGFNTYLAGLKAERGAKIDFTFLQFDSVGIDKVHVATPVAEVPLLTDATFEPRAGTPLIEACIKTINAVETSLRHRDDSPRVVICFQTDGEENQSGAEYTWDRLSTLIAAKKGAGWEFIFMGAGIDAYQQARSMGIGVANTVSYGKGHDHTIAAFAASAQNSGAYASLRSANTMFGALQKQSAGDVFDPNLQQAQSEVDSLKRRLDANLKS